MKPPELLAYSFALAAPFLPVGMVAVGVAVFLALAVVGVWRERKAKV